MARSLTFPEHQPSGRSTHGLSSTKFKISSSDVGFTQSIERRGLIAEYPIAYAVGSGNHAIAYLVRVGDYLFQSPISYYTKRKVWSMAPGFEQDRLPDFTRPVTAECLLCHTGSVFPVDLTLNRYKPPIVGALSISCDRCHGPVDAHLRKPSRANIVNPARLPPKARDSVCEQCHLSGEARIANPGRKASDFQPGQELEQVFSTYVFASPLESSTEASSIKVISHVEQLRKSACARNSRGRLWCGTCHNPHNETSDPQTYFRDRCLSCHGPDLVESHPRPSDNCVGCHMPTRPAKDGGHTVFTDHRITRRPKPGMEVRKDRLVAWRAAPAAFETRNLGLAYVAVGERDHLTQCLEQGWQLLVSIRQPFADDHAVLTSLGVVYLRKGHVQDAVRSFQRALELQPGAAAYQVNLATALAEAGESETAIGHLNRAIELDPSLEIAYRRLVEIYGKSHRDAAANDVFRRYLLFRPQSLSAREALRGPQDRAAGAH
jgi:tetratricopeptide (TPR) repeat protein